MTGKEDLESLIKRYVILGKRSPKGYETVKCAACADYKTRGGFKFEGGGVHYSCFNCGVSAGYNPTGKTRHLLSKKFTEVLDAFGIPIDEAQKCVALNFFTPEEQKASPEKKLSTFPTQDLSLPPGAQLIDQSASPWRDVAVEYLRARGLEKMSSRCFITDDEAFAGRLIIPYYFRQKIIYFQARAMDESIDPRYKNPTVSRDNIFYNMDALYDHSDLPLFITEGAIDAESIGSNAIGIGGSVLSDFQMRELKRVSNHRTLIFVIDKNKNGHKLGSKALEQGWSVVCLPDNIDDSNAGLIMMGHLWLISHLSTNAAKGFAGKLLLELKCRPC